MADNMIVICPNCSEKMSVPADYAGLEGHCPKCKKAFVFCDPEKPPVSKVMPEVRPPGPPVQPQVAPRAPVIQTPPSNAPNLGMAGWICFFVGMALLVLCPIIPFYSPFFVASFVLAIVLLVKEKGTDGLALLLMTLLLPAFVGGMIFLLGVGAALSAFSGFAKEVEGKQNALVAQQTAALNRLSGQQAPFSRLASPPPMRSQPIFLQPPAAPPVQVTTAQPLPSREVTYDGLLQVLNEFGDEYNHVGTTLQKKDVRARAQAKAAAFVENAGMTLVGTVSDVQDGSDGKVTLSFWDFDASAPVIQTHRKLFGPSLGRLTASFTTEEALKIKKGQKVWITGKPNVVWRDNLFAAVLDEAANPSLIKFRFSLDIETLLTLRMRDYTVSFAEKRSQSALSAKKKPYVVVVGSQKASP